jgi:hypothetical protein
MATYDFTKDQGKLLKYTELHNLCKQHIFIIHSFKHVQKRAFSIISLGISYPCNLDVLNLNTLKERRQDLCTKLFNSIVSDPSNKLHHLLPPRQEAKYNLRHKREFDMPRLRTNRFKNTFIQAMSSI